MRKEASGRKRKEKKGKKRGKGERATPIQVVAQLA